MRELFPRVTKSMLCTVWTVSVLSAQTTTRSELEAHYQRAMAALHSKQDTLAEREFREILRLDPKSASSHANLGVIAFSKKDFFQAAEEFRSAVGLQPGLWDAKAFLGMSELRLGHQDSARRLLRDSFQHVQDRQVKSEAGADLVSLDYQSGNLDHAVDVLRELLRTQPTAEADVYMAYQVYLELAARQVATLAATAPDSAEMHQVLAQGAASQDDFTSAIAQYRKALASNPQLPEVHYELGEMILANSQAETAREEAEKEFNLSLASDPGNAYDYYMLGEIAWMRSKPKDALASYEHSLALNPELVDAHIAAGKALNALDRPAEALAHLQGAVRLEPRNEVAPLQVGPGVPEAWPVRRRQPRAGTLPGASRFPRACPQIVPGSARANGPAPDDRLRGVALIVNLTAGPESGINPVLNLHNVAGVINSRVQSP